MTDLANASVEQIQRVITALNQLPADLPLPDVPAGSPGTLAGSCFLGDSGKLVYGSNSGGRFVELPAPPTTAAQQRDLRRTAPHLAGFDDGGIVGGPLGMPQLVWAHGRETIFPTHKPARSTISRTRSRAASPARSAIRGAAPGRSTFTSA